MGSFVILRQVRRCACGYRGQKAEKKINLKTRRKVITASSLYYTIVCCDFQYLRTQFYFLLYYIVALKMCRLNFSSAFYSFLIDNVSNTVFQSKLKIFLEKLRILHTPIISIQLRSSLFTYYLFVSVCIILLILILFVIVR